MIKLFKNPHVFCYTTQIPRRGNTIPIPNVNITEVYKTCLSHSPIQTDSFSKKNNHFFKDEGNPSWGPMILMCAVIFFITVKNKCVFHASEMENLERLRTLKQRLNDKLKGQEEAVEYVSQMIQTFICGFHNRNRPLGVMLFAGPTGTGKTEMAKQIAEELGVELVRFDMSEYSHESNLTRFIGSAPGYTGSEKEGKLVEVLKNGQVKVVLFDEIEKADPNIFPIFLQLFDEGRLTSGLGTTVKANKTIFIMTTNLGANLLNENSQISQDSKMSVQERLLKKIEPLLIDKFSLELYNRFDKVLVYKNLTSDVIKKITYSKIEILKKEIKNSKNIDLEIDEDFVNYVIQKGYSKTLGARELERRLQQEIRNSLVDAYVQGGVKSGDSVHLFINNDKATCAKIDSNSRSSHNKGDEPELVVDCETYQDIDKLIGKWAIRDGLSNEYSIADRDSPHKILLKDNNRYFVKSSATGYELVLYNNFNRKWREVSASESPKHFFENQCSKLTNSSKSAECLELTQMIFGSSQKFLIQLDPKFPLENLEKYYTNKNDSNLELIKKLKKIIPKMKIVQNIESKTSFESPQAPKHSPNYDFKDI